MDSSQPPTHDSIPPQIPRLESPLPLHEEAGPFLSSKSTKLQPQKPTPSSPLTTTSQHSPATISFLNSRLQLLNLGAPIWDITIEPGTERCAQRFIGTLTIGQDLPEKIVVGIVEPGASTAGAGLPSKKDVKTVLAQKALLLLEVVIAIPKPEAVKPAPVKGREGSEDGINWIGRILEYNNSIPLEHRVLTYTESSTPLPNNPGPTLFDCTLDLSIPTVSLGPEFQSFEMYTVCKFPSIGTPPHFPTKKGAKYHCSQLAGLELVKLGLLQEDGTLPPKVTIHPPQPSNEPPVSNFVPQRCERLGLPPPRYEYICVSGDPSSVNAFVDCSAHFPSIHGLPDPLAIVKNVYGKKRAKEECARVLMDMLDKVEKWRLKGSGLWEES